MRSLMENATAIVTFTLLIGYYQSNNSIVVNLYAKKFNEDEITAIEEYVSSASMETDERELCQELLERVKEIRRSEGC
jgi:ribosomal protein S13